MQSRQSLLGQGAGSSIEMLRDVIDRTVSRSMSGAIPNLVREVVGQTVVDILARLQSNPAIEGGPLYRGGFGQSRSDEFRIVGPSSMSQRIAAGNGIDFDLALGCFFKQGSPQWRSLEQKYACWLVSRRQRSVAFYAPCDAGKSLAYQLPVYAFDGPALGQQRGLNVVIVPYIALADNIVKTCLERGIKARRWTALDPGLESVTVGVVDTVMSREFETVIRNAVMERQLVRIVIDEVHVVITEANFREKLGKLKWLQQLAVPFLLLSATIPPSLESGVYSALGMMPQDVDVVRLAAHRLRAKHRVMIFDKDDWAAVVQREVTSALVDPESRAIVFACGLEQAQTMAKLDGTTAYTGSSLADERHDIISRFTDGTNRTLYATTALAAGVDLPEVSLVIVMGPVHGAISYEQQIGRGGRGDKPYTSILLLDSTDNVSTCSTEGGKELTDIIKTRACMRTISEYLHGIRLTCDNLRSMHSPQDVAQCDHCNKAPTFQPTAEVVPRPPLAIQVRARQAQNEQLFVETLLDRQRRALASMVAGTTVDSVCANCLCARLEEDLYKRHSTATCPLDNAFRPPSLVALNVPHMDTNALLSDIKWNGAGTSIGVCKTCWVSYTAHTGPCEVDCMYGRTVFHVCLAAWLHLRPLLAAKFGRGCIENLADYLDFIVQLVPDMPLSNRGMAEVLGKDLVLDFVVSHRTDIL